MSTHVFRRVMTSNIAIAVMLFIVAIVAPYIAPLVAAGVMVFALRSRDRALTAIAAVALVVTVLVLAAALTFKGASF